MKKILCFLFLLFAAITSNYAQHPIPSYGVKVNPTAAFTEQSNCLLKAAGIMAKREINIKVTCSGTLSCNANIWIYSLDGQNIYGPFQVAGGETFTFPIDDREWGVLVESEDDVLVDVWIDNGEEVQGE